MLLSRRNFICLAGAAVITPAFAKEKILRAYNIEMLHQSLGEIEPRGDGWVFGLPPGISTAQWPLDPNNGYPLNHGFTIRLPEDYRVHGPEIVGLSFFAVAFDHNDGMPLTAPAVRAFFDETAPERPDDPFLVPFWEARQSEHPRLFRMRDVLDLEYAVILLTEQEFSGPFAQPPRLGRGSRAGVADQGIGRRVLGRELLTGLATAPGVFYLQAIGRYSRSASDIQPCDQDHAAHGRSQCRDCP